MRKVFFSFAGLFAALNLFSQNVGIGIPAPLTTLHVRSTTNSNPLIIDGFGNNTYYSILENGTYRGYWGSYSGNPEDVDFGTGAGTTGKLHLTIQATPRMTIDNAGNVGIGTTIPNYKLHVTGGDIFLQSSSGYLKMGYDGSNQWRWGTTGGGADILMSTSTDGSSFTFRHYFDQGGNVGIGTGNSAPGARLEVSTTASEVIRMRGAHPFMSFYDNADGYRGYFWYDGTDIVMGSSTVGLKFVGFANTGMRITTGGQVVVGTLNNPATGYKLSVDGKFICEEARVQLSGSWPDYVFGDNYKLMPIEELEKSIRQHRHLPNIPSAEDITLQKGFDLGDMNKRLLEKVEELTLYIIELKKENNGLSERITRLEEKKN